MQKTQSNEVFSLCSIHIKHQSSKVLSSKTFQVLSFSNFS